MSDDKDIAKIVELYERIQFREQAGALEREIWISASRQIFDPGPREPCWICGKFLSITQAHHVIPLTTQYDRGFQYPDPEHVWLCPNHHAMAHLYIQSDNRSTAIAAMRSRDRTIATTTPDLSEEEFAKLLELMQRAGRSPE